MIHSTPRTDQERACQAVRELVKLGLSQKDIAGSIGVTQPTISRVNGIQTNSDLHVSSSLANRLETLVQRERLDRFVSAMRALPLQVVETCNNQGALIDATARDELRSAIVSHLAQLSAIGHVAQVRLPQEVAGALATIGPGTWLFVTNHSSNGSSGSAAEDEANRCRSQIRLLQERKREWQVAIHELDHLIDALQSTLPSNERRRRPTAAF